MRPGGAGSEPDGSDEEALPVVYGVGGTMTSEVTEWLALHRAHEGSVTKLDTDYFTAGRPVDVKTGMVTDEPG